MDHRVPKIGAAIGMMLAVSALITFVFLNQKFEGPDPVGDALRSTYQLTARFENSKTLPSKQPVLHKGVSVGRVRSVSWDAKAKEAVVTFTLDDEVRPVHRDAKLQIGERSLLGDPYLNLLDRGTAERGEIEDGGEIEDTIKPVNFDEALDFLDEDGRGRVRSLIDTFAEGVSRRGNGERLNGTVGGLSGTVGELRRLTETLRGQEDQIADLVSGASNVIGTLGDREESIRTIAAEGRLTVDALASNTNSLGQAIEELPRLLDSGRKALGDARPLLSSAAPLVAELRRVAPRLVPALREGAPFSIGPISKDLVAVIKALPAQRKISEEILPQVQELNVAALPVVRGAGPASRNSVPIADYLAPRAKSIGAFYALGSSVVANSDEVGRYARFAILGDPTLQADAPTSAWAPTGTCVETERFCFNSFPLPNDTLDHQPFGGEYPRLMPFEPPPRNSVIKGR